MLLVKVSTESLRSLNALIKANKQLEVTLRDRSSALSRIKENMIERWATNFSSQGQIYGKWKGLSSSWTIPERASGGYGTTNMLVRTNTLFTHFVRSNEEGEVSSQAVTWNIKNSGGRNAPGGWAVRHHYGYSNPLPKRNAIPARVLWAVNEDDEDRINDIINEYVEEVLRRLRYI